MPWTGQLSSPPTGRVVVAPTLYIMEYIDVQKMPMRASTDILAGQTGRDELECGGTRIGKPSDTAVGS